MSTEPHGKPPETFEAAKQRVQNYIEEALAAAHARFASGDPMNLQSTTLAYLVEFFDIHAHYYRHLVINYDMAHTWYEPYLSELSNGVIQHAETMTSGWTSPLPGAPLNRARFFQELSIKLAARSSHWKSEGLKRARELANTESSDPPVAVKSRIGEPVDCKAERRALVDAYIEDVFRSTNKRITRKAIWQAARYQSRSEFERWERCDGRATATADERFRRLLIIEKPHLKK